MVDFLKMEHIVKNFKQFFVKLFFYSGKEYIFGIAVLIHLMIQKLRFLMYVMFLGLSSQAQDLNYALSDDSLVNHYASIKRVYYATQN